jgi:hypothetical protein
MLLTVQLYAADGRLAVVKAFPFEPGIGLYGLEPPRSVTPRRGAFRVEAAPDPTLGGQDTVGTPGPNSTTRPPDLPTTVIERAGDSCTPDSASTEVEAGGDSDALAIKRVAAPKTPNTTINDSNLERADVITICAHFTSEQTYADILVLNCPSSSYNRA